MWRGLLCGLPWALGASRNGVGPVPSILPPGLSFPRLLEQGIHSDVVFVVHGKPFRVHRCVLGARSAYFANMLDTKWKGKSVVVLRHPLVCPFRVAEGHGLPRNSRGSCWVAASDIPFCLSAHRSTPWPLGPCCSTCTQVTPWVQGRRRGSGLSFWTAVHLGVAGLTFHL